MKEFILKRVTPNEELYQETYGVLIYDFIVLCDIKRKIPICVTLELPWVSNEHNVSCIPDGEYICKPYKRKSGVWAWEIMDVPNRKDILLHGGQIKNHSLGCPLIGEQFKKLQIKGKWYNGIFAAPNEGYREFLSIADPTKEKEIKLTIIWA